MNTLSVSNTTKTRYNLAIVGATGMVGRMFLKVLEERDFPINKIVLYASRRSAGQSVIFKGEEHIVEELTPENIKRYDFDMALFSAGGSISDKYAPLFALADAVVIDNSSRFRMEPDIPLIVPEVNPHAIEQYKNRNIIANPNCSTIQAMPVLAPLMHEYGLKRVIYSTYQAVSGAGKSGYDDLARGLDGGKPNKFPHPIAFNILPHIDVFLDSGYTKEEQKMIDETRKILEQPELPVTATTVRVPVYNSHCASINVEFETEFELDSLREILKNAPGVTLMDQPDKNIYPMPILSDGRDDVLVGRIRRDGSVKSGVNMFIAADNIRKGAATNAVQIAELLALKWSQS